MISPTQIPSRPLRVVYYPYSIRHYVVADKDNRYLAGCFTRRGAKKKLEKLNSILVDISLYNKRV